MTELTWLISYLSYGRFGVILKTNTIKKLALAVTVFVPQSKEVSMCQNFLSVIERQLFFVTIFFVAFTLALVAFTQNSKEPKTREKFSKCPVISRVRSLLSPYNILQFCYGLSSVTRSPCFISVIYFLVVIFFLYFFLCSRAHSQLKTMSEPLLVRPSVRKVVF